MPFLRLAAFTAALVLAAAPSWAAVTIDQKILGGGRGDVVAQGQIITLMFEIRGVKVSHTPALPAVGGLTVSGSGNDSVSAVSRLNYFFTPTHTGDLVIPAFAARADDGQVLHLGPVKLHVVK